MFCIVFVALIICIMAAEILEQLANGATNLVGPINIGNEKQFPSMNGTVKDFIRAQENGNTRKKTDHDVKLFTDFLLLKLNAYCIY